MKAKPITIDGVRYVPEGDAGATLPTDPDAQRVIVVLDRGWIFVGRLSTHEGLHTLTEASNIRKWDSGGFGGLTASRKESGAVLDPCAPVQWRAGSEILIVRVGDGW